METLSWQLAMQLDEYIRSQGHSIEKRLNLGHLILVTIQSMRGGSEKCREEIAEIEEQFDVLFDHFNPVLDLESYVVEEKNLFVKNLNKVVGREFALINRENLVSQRVMGEMLAQRGKGMLDD